MENENTKNCKVVLIGESGVGKTSIIQRYVHNNYSSSFNTTLGATYATKSINYVELSKIIKFEIWDTAGQERYRSLSKIFYKDSETIILVYDITREESFQQLKAYWYEQIKENSAKTSIIVVVGNKSDESANETVKNSQARKFARDIGAIFRLVSAKKDLGIEELFNSIGAKLIDPEFIDRSIEKDSISFSNLAVLKDATIVKTNKKSCC